MDNPLSELVPSRYSRFNQYETHVLLMLSRIARGLKQLTDKDDTLASTLGEILMSVNEMQVRLEAIEQGIVTIAANVQEATAEIPALIASLNEQISALQTSAPEIDFSGVNAVIDRIGTRVGQVSEATKTLTDIVPGSPAPAPVEEPAVTE